MRLEKENVELVSQLHNTHVEMKALTESVNEKDAIIEAMHVQMERMAQNQRALQEEISSIKLELLKQVSREQLLQLQAQQAVEQTAMAQATLRLFEQTHVTQLKSQQSQLAADYTAQIEGLQAKVKMLAEQLEKYTASKGTDAAQFNNETDLTGS